MDLESYRSARVDYTEAYARVIASSIDGQGGTMATDKRLTRALLAFATAAASITCAVAAPSYFEVSRGSNPHDVAAAPGSGAPVYYTAQRTGKLGILDPKTGKYEEIALGARSAPHGVIVGPDGAPWITDGGQNAIVRVDPKTNEVKRFPLPQTFAAVSLNTAAFDRDGILWFTGQAGSYGRLDPRTGELRMFGAPRGSGPDGITPGARRHAYLPSP